ncbi:MAG: bifunctional 3-(3-hydroxy-phenyl)propionate/3-hydroxycinnamic acid hydroxylase [Deltaproteobacteria bacterium]|nr:bifunctional 3-(3-hydroxy-phenyl)propionate/3-hydroxycinnamic acid hydroxylase [Deltaproteobacteria bacterium]
MIPRTVETIGSGSAARAEVAIVGAGPVGMTLANLLGVYGVRTVLLERNATTVAEPRAVAIDAESLRTMQAAGLYEEVAADTLLGFHVDYVNGRGRTLLSIDLGPTPYGHAQQNSFDQPIFERALRLGLERFPHVDVRFGHAVEGFSQDASGVSVRGTSSDGRPFSIEAEYLIACDGGRSAMRQQLGIGMSGATAPEKWLVIDTIDAHLAGAFDCRFFCDPRRPAMSIRKRGTKRRWEWMLMPGESEEDLLDDGMIARLLAPHTRPEQVKLERKCVYTFHSLVADRYREGRVLLAGDAAHMMPPFAGQGMNGGIRDARDLAWKLALVVVGAADQALLDSYEVERRSHVKAATALANRLGDLIQPTSRVRAALRDAVFAVLGVVRGGQQVIERSLMRSLRAPRMRRGVFVPSEGGRDEASRLAGQMIFQPQVRTSGGETVPLDDVLGPGFAVVGYDADPAKTLDVGTLAYWRGLGARLVHVLPRGAKATDGTIIDETGHLAEWFGKACSIVAVRPDRFCAAELEPRAAVEATAAFESLLRGVVTASARRAA